MNEPKILTLDIETSALEAESWGPKYEADLIRITKHTQILSFSAKWLNGKQITKGMCDYPGYRKGILDDKQLLKELHSLIDEADVIITQNGVQFDMKIINARLRFHRIAPPSPYKNIDTKIEAKKYIKLPSYSLDDMCQYFEIGGKLSHSGYSLWRKCKEGDEKAWKLMKRYNAQDVRITEALYLVLRPLMKSHPNFSVYKDRKACPKCGSEKVHSRGYTANSTSVFQRAVCLNCGGWFRFGKAVEKIKNTRTNI